MGLLPGRPGLRPAQPQAGGPRRVPSDAGEGALARPACDDRGRRLPGAGGCQRADVGRVLGRRLLLGCAPLPSMHALIVVLVGVSSVFILMSRFWSYVRYQYIRLLN